MTAPAASHRIITDASGRPILVKRAAGPEGGARLTREAALLRDLAHPGLTRVVDLVQADAHTELHLAWVGPHSLATVTSVPAPDAGRVVAGVAEVLADLHDLGITHGRLTPDHVLLGADARPVLTGLADAVDDERGDRSADVAALGSLLTQLVRPLQDSSMIPSGRHRRGRHTGLAGALLTVADLAAADDRDIRPSARDLARRLHALAGPVGAHRSRRPRLGRLRRPHPPTDPMAPRPPTGLRIAPVAIDRQEARPHRDHDDAPTRVPPDDPLLRGAPPLPPPGAPHPPSGPGDEAADRPRPGTAQDTDGRGPHDGPLQRATPSPDRDQPGLPRAAASTAARPPTLEPGSPAAPATSPRSPTAARDHRRARARMAAVPRRRRLVVTAVMAAVLASLIATVALRSGPSTDVAVRTVPTTTAPVTGPRAAPTTDPAPETTTGVDGSGVDPLPPEDPAEDPPVGGCPPVTAGLAADIDGDGCPDALRIQAGRVTAGDTTWVVGRPGDAVAVADWDCDGTATVASLRPSTGEVFVFERWVTPGDELTVRALATVPGADGLRAVDDDGDGCAALTATEPDGTATDIPVRSA